jgi:hypothetical protein
MNYENEEVSFAQWRLEGSTPGQLLVLKKPSWEPMEVAPNTKWIDSRKSYWNSDDSSCGSTLNRVSPVS